MRYMYEGEERRERRSRKNKKKEPKRIFSFSRINYGHPLSLFLIPILCIDKLSNPHTFKFYLLFLSSSFLSYSDLWGGEGGGGMVGEKAQAQQIEDHLLFQSAIAFGISRSLSIFQRQSRQAQKKSRPPDSRPPMQLDFQYSRRLI